MYYCVVLHYVELYCVILYALFDVCVCTSIMSIVFGTKFSIDAVFFSFHRKGYCIILYTGGACMFRAKRSRNLYIYICIYRALSTKQPSTVTEVIHGSL